jgi:hypothetical protein
VRATDPTCTPIHAAGTVASTPYDGHWLYAWARASPAVYRVQGRYIHRCRTASKPLFEIRGDRIYRYAHGVALFEIRDGRFVHPVGSPCRLYEMRCSTHA